jgi:hypothetical protein
VLSQINLEKKNTLGPLESYVGDRGIVNAHAKEPFYGVNRIKGRCLLLAGSTVKFTDPRFLGCLTCACGWVISGPAIRFVISSSYKLIGHRKCGAMLAITFLKHHSAHFPQCEHLCDHPLAHSTERRFAWPTTLPFSREQPSRHTPRTPAFQRPTDLVLVSADTSATQRLPCIGDVKPASKISRA